MLEAEKMAAENPFMEQSLLYQDLEKIRFSENLRKNPSDYSAFVNERVDQMTNEAFHRKRTAFQKAQIDLSRYMDMDHNANFYRTRNADLERVQKAIDDNNNRIASQVGSDKDNSKRQYEINEYFYHNKLETLFFLQLFFISTLAMAIVLYLQKTNLLTGTMAGLLTVLIILVVLVTGVYRYTYTSQTRDKRLWHRRYFPEESPVAKSALKCGPNGQVEFDLNQIIPEAVTRCGEEAVINTQKAMASMESEMLGYQQGTASIKSKLTDSCGANKISPGSFCSLYKE
jgi:hypothetical protein